MYAVTDSERGTSGHPLHTASETLLSAGVSAEFSPTAPPSSLKIFRSESRKRPFPSTLYGNTLLYIVTLPVRNHIPLPGRRPSNLAKNRVLAVVQLGDN